MDERREKEILEVFRDCAVRVRDELVNVREKDLTADEGMGADGTPTKGIDKRAEKTALDFLRRNCECSILSEEVGVIEGEGDGTIIMDPVDGTNNAILGIPFYAISLAYTTGDLSDTTVGYVMNLSSGKEYHAIEEKGAYADGNELQPVLEDDWNFSVYMGKKAHDDCAKVASIPRRTRSLGSAALEISMVAEGIFDLYYLKTPERKRSLRIMDIAAATLILRESGGEVYDGDMKPINMKLDPKERKDVIAIHDDKIKEVLP